MPNLEPARVALERLMEDEATFLRDPDTRLDDVFDPETGEITSVPTAASSVWSGRCKATPYSGVTPRVSVEGGQTYVTRLYQVSIPLDSFEPREGDICVITASRRDAYIVDKWFTVREVLYSTFAVQRRVIAELRTVAEDA